jgi:hypothetical protein
LARSDGPPQPLNAQFVDGITLQSARFSTAPRSAAPLAVELTWQVEQAQQVDYHVFLHLLDPEGEKVAQADGQPVNWTRPTTTWQPGETIIDRYALWLPPLPPGSYTLIAGLYQPDDGQRLLTITNQDFVQLAAFHFE